MPPSSSKIQLTVELDLNSAHNHMVCIYVTLLQAQIATVSFNCTAECTHTHTHTRKRSLCKRKELSNSLVYVFRFTHRHTHTLAACTVFIAKQFLPIVITLQVLHISLSHMRHQHLKYMFRYGLISLSLSLYRCNWYIHCNNLALCITFL